MKQTKLLKTRGQVSPHLSRHFLSLIMLLMTFVVGTNRAWAETKEISSTTIFSNFSSEGISAENWITYSGSDYNITGTKNYINPTTDTNENNSSKHAANSAQVKSDVTITLNVTGANKVTVYAYHTNASASRNLVVSTSESNKNTVAVTAGTAVKNSLNLDASVNNTVTIKTDESKGVYVYAVKLECDGGSTPSACEVTGLSYTPTGGTAIQGEKTGATEWTVVIPYSDAGNVGSKYRIAYTWSYKATSELDATIDKYLPSEAGSQNSQSVKITAEDGTEKTWSLKLVRGAIPLVVKSAIIDTETGCAGEEIVLPTIPAAQGTALTFESNARYSIPVINSRLNNFDANTTAMGFGVFSDVGAKTKKEAGTKSNLDYVPGLVGKAVLEAVDYYKNNTNVDVKPWFYAIQHYANKYDIKDAGKNGESFDDLNAVKMYSLLNKFAVNSTFPDGSVYTNAQTRTAVENRYKDALSGIRKANTSYAITSSTNANAAGGWWHKESYDNQMWCDGQYMGPALFATMINDFESYSAVASTGTDWDLITKQFNISWNYLWNDSKKLLYHAFSATPNASTSSVWAKVACPYDNTCSTNSAFWGRADGWYFLALVDVLEQMDKAGVSHSDANYTSLRTKLNTLAAGIAARQDATSGCWYQVLDETSSSLSGNYLESSATAIFLTAYMKGHRLGYIDTDYTTLIKKGYRGFVENFMISDGNGGIHLINCCRSAGLGGSNNRKGDNDYYLNGSDVTKTTNNTEGKVLGAFIMAATEYERAYLEEPTALSSECAIDNVKYNGTTMPTSVDGNTYNFTIPYDDNGQAESNGTKYYDFNYTISANASCTVAGENQSPNGEGIYVMRKSLGTTAGKNNSFSVVVTAEDGTTQATYTINLTRGAEIPAGGETTLFAWEATNAKGATAPIDGADLSANTYGSLTAGQSITAVVGTAGKLTAATAGYIKTESNDVAVEIELNGTTFQDGDVITIIGQNGGDGERGFVLTQSSVASATASGGLPTSKSSVKSNDNTYTVTVTSAWLNSTNPSKLRIFRVGGNMYIKSINVTRPGSHEESVAVTGITLSQTAANMTAGGELTLTATVAPDNATNKNVNWTSSDENVAVVTGGVVTAKAAGAATITATAADGSGVSTTCAITVKQDPTRFSPKGGSVSKDLLVSGDSNADNVPVILIEGPSTVSKDDFEVSVSGSAVTADIRNTGTDNGTPIVRVNVMAGDSPGDATITVRYKGNETFNPKECTIDYHVRKPLTLSLSEDAVSFDQYATAPSVTLSAKSGSEDVAGLTYTVNTTDADIVEATTAGAITLKNNKVGTATLTISYAGDDTYAVATPAVLAVTINEVKAAATSEIVHFTGKQLNIPASSTMISAFEVSGSYADNKGTKEIDGIDYNACVKMESATEISFTTTKTTTVTFYFDASGTFKLNGTNTNTDADGIYSVELPAGSYNVTKNTGFNLYGVKFISNNGGSSDIKVTDINVTPAESTLTMGGTTTVDLEAEVLPETATDNSFTWSTSDASIATVSSEGVVNALKPGVVTIKATANDGSGVEGAATITVKPQAPTFDPASGSIDAGAVVTIQTYGDEASAINLYSGWGGAAKTASELSNDKLKRTVNSEKQFKTNSATTVNHVLSAKVVINGVESDVTSVDYTVSEVTTYSATATNDGNGTATVSKESGIAKDEEVTFTAIASSDYKFVNWTDASGNVVSTANPYVATVTENISLKANFIANTTATGTGTFTLEQLNYFGKQTTGGVVQSINESEGTEMLTLSTNDNQRIEGSKTGNKGTKVQNKDNNNNKGSFVLTPADGVTIKKVTFTTERGDLQLTPAPSSDSNSTTANYGFEFDTDGSITFTNNSAGNIYVHYITVEYEYNAGEEVQQLQGAFSGNIEDYVGANNITMPTLSVTKNGSATSDYNVTYTSSNTAVATISDGKVNLVGAGSATITAEITSTEANVKGTKVSFIVTSKALEPLSLSIADFTANSNDASYTMSPLTVMCGSEVLAADEYDVIYAHVSGDQVTKSITGGIGLIGTSGAWQSGTEEMSVTVKPKFAALTKYHCVTEATTEFMVTVVEAGSKLQPAIDMMDEISLSTNNAGQNVTSHVIYNGQILDEYFTFSYSISNSNVTLGSSTTNVVKLTTKSSTCTATLTITATPKKIGDIDYAEVYKTASKNITVHVATLDKFSSVSINPSSITAYVGNPVATPQITVTDKDGNALDADEYTLIWSSSATGVLDINKQTGAMSALAQGTSTITVVVTKDGYEGEPLTCQVTVNDPTVYKIPAKGTTYKNGDTFATPANDALVTIGGWIFNGVTVNVPGVKEVTFGKTTWSSTRAESQAPSGFSYAIDGRKQENPRSEDANNSQPESVNLYDATISPASTTILDPMFNVPVEGAFYAFTAKTNGTITARVLQKGVFDNDKKSSDSKDKFVYRPQRRVFVIDEAGNFVASTAKLEVTTGKLPKSETESAALISGSAATTEKGKPETKMSLYIWDLEGKKAFTDIADMNTHFGGGIPFDLTDGVASNFVNKVYENTVKNDDMHNAAYNKGLSGAKGWSVLVDAPVTYTFDVKAGKTYYLYNFASKLGFYGYDFKADKDVTVDEVVYNETANDNTVSVTADNHVASVSLNRKFNVGKWNAAVLPFSMTKEQVDAIFGHTYDKAHPEGTDIIYFEKVDGNKVVYTRHAYNTIVAGKPFLIKPSGVGVDTNEDGTISLNTANVTNFPYVTIENTAPTAWGRDAGTAEFYWTSGYNVMNIVPNDYYINSNGDLILRETDAKIQAFRGFLKKRTPGQAKLMNVVYKSIFNEDPEGVATAIEGVMMDENGNLVEVPTSGKIYSLNGQVVSENARELYSMPKGIYVVNGKKYVVK